MRAHKRYEVPSFLTDDTPYVPFLKNWHIQNDGPGIYLFSSTHKTDSRRGITHEDTFQLPLFVSLPEQAPRNDEPQAVRKVQGIQPFNSQFLNKLLSLLPERLIEAAAYPLFFIELNVINPAKESYQKLHRLINTFVFTSGRISRNTKAIAFVGVGSVLFYATMSFIVNNLNLIRIFLTVAGKVALGGVAIYGVTIIAVYLSLSSLKHRLNNEFDSIENLINEKNYDAAFEKLRHIHFIYLPLLQDSFPYNFALRAKYKYLYVRASSCDSYSEWYLKGFLDALEFVDYLTEDQKFKCVRGAINSYAFPYLEKQKNPDYMFEDYLGEYYNEIKPLRQYITTVSDCYKQLGAQMRASIKECIELILKPDAKKAITAFDSIEIDPYTFEAYPDISVLYFQLEAIVFQIRVTDKSGFPIIDKDNFYAARDRLDSVQAYLQSYYPEYVEYNTNLILAFKRFNDAWPVHPKYKKNAITTLDIDRSAIMPYKSADSMDQNLLIENVKDSEEEENRVRHSSSPTI